MGGLFSSFGTGLMNFGKNLFGGGGLFGGPPNPNDFRTVIGGQIQPWDLNSRAKYEDALRKHKISQANMKAGAEGLKAFTPKDNYIPGTKKGGGNKMGQFAVLNPTMQWTGEPTPSYAEPDFLRRKRRRA